MLTNFDPVVFSHEECQWLLDNLDKPAVVALRDQRPGVNPNAVRPLLEGISELQQLQEHEGQAWVGVEAVRAAIRTYLEQDAKWESDHRRAPKRVPRFPSQYSFDSRGRAFRGGTGSDSGRVKTYFKDGARVPFAIDLVPTLAAFQWQAPGTDAPTEGLTLNEDQYYFECFCGHRESFKEGSRKSKGMARARMSRHLRSAKDEVDRHRELHTAEFGQADAA